MKPQLEGVKISVWKIHANYLLYPLTTDINPKFESGFRVNAILSSWACIESFIRSCIYQMIATKYDEFDIPNLSDRKKSWYKSTKFKILWFLKNDNQKWDYNLQRKTDILNGLSKMGYSKLIILSQALNKNLKSELPNETWSFMENLYKLRNALMHGQNLTIQKSNSPHMKNHINSEYNKALRYLNGKGVIDYDNLFTSFNEADIFNRKATDFIINQTIETLDGLASIFESTMDSGSWIESRKK